MMPTWHCEHDELKLKCLNCNKIKAFGMRVSYVKSICIPPDSKSVEKRRRRQHISNLQTEPTKKV